MKKNVFKGFEPKNSQLFIEAVTLFLDERFPKRVKSVIRTVTKEEKNYKIALENGFTTIEVTMEEEFLSDYKKMKQREEEEKEVREKMYKKAIEKNKRT